MALTIKQEKFAQVLFATGNASEAYRQAYDCKNMSEKDIGNEAYDLKNHPEISPKIKELQAIAAQKHQVTVDSISRELEELRLIGIESGHIPAAVTAVMGKAKLHGLLIDKQEIDIGIKNLQQRIDSKIFDGQL